MDPGTIASSVVRNTIVYRLVVLLILCYLAYAAHHNHYHVHDTNDEVDRMKVLLKPAETEKAEMP